MIHRTLVSVPEGLRDVACTRFEALERGRYDRATIDASPVDERAEAFCRDTFGVDAAVIARRVTIHRAGDFALMADRPPEADFEIIVDLSETAGDEGQVHYVRAGDTEIVPQAPGTMSLVALDASTFRWVRYLSYTRCEARAVYRLWLWLKSSSPASSEKRALRG